MNIEITPKKTDGVERLLQISVPVETVRDAEDKAARRYATRVRLPGFRPGKAPPAMVKKKFADAIRQETLESLVQEAYKEVVEREQLKLASQPHVHDVKFGDNEPLTFELHLEVRPEIALSRTQGFRVQRTERHVTDEQVREQVDQVREQRATWTPVNDRPAPGDMVTVALATADETGAMPEGKQYPLVLGAGQAIPGIEELIMEAQPGQTVERPVKWPEDFPDESQRSQTKKVRVTVQDVKRKTLPELDDAFAREVGDFDSIDALRKAVREDLEANAQRETESEVRQRLLDDIIGANQFDIPPSWVAQLVDAYANAYQVPEGEKERFAGEFRPMAERQVRRDLVIDTVAERENLTATEADLDDRIAETAGKRGADPGQLYVSLQKAGRLKELERSITEDKVFKWLLERNTVETNG
ncbi:MAG TPA: trigger factor [Gemmatimonadaceae bacterium]|jgi:trigger factor|nr:trigger factor [Gemmatimonadaceae bacterium]